MNRELYQLADRQSIGGPRGHADGREGREFGHAALEATGIPSWARGIEDVRYNNPGDAFGEFAMGGLQTGSLLALPFDAALAGRTPRAPMGMPPRLPETAPLPMGATEEMFTPGGGGWLQRQIDISGRARDLPETADNLGSIQMPQLEVPQSPYDDWLAARRQVLPEMIAAERAHEAAVGPTTLDTIINNTQDPRFSFESMHSLGDDLGEYGVGGRLENHPLLGTPEIGADPLANPVRPGIRSQRPMRQGPNEDRYLFGRPQRPAPPRISEAPDAGSGGAGQRDRLERLALTPEREAQLRSRTRDLSDTTPLDVRIRIDTARQVRAMEEAMQGIETWSPERIADFHRVIERMSPTAAERMREVLSRRVAEIRTQEIFAPQSPDGGASGAGQFPLRGYHGSGENIQSLRDGELFWVSEKPELANEYAAMRGAEPEWARNPNRPAPAPNVVPVRYRIGAEFDADAMPDRAVTIDDFLNEAAAQAEAAGRTVDRELIARRAVEIRQAARAEESGPHYSRHDFWYDPSNNFGRDGATLLRQTLQDLGFDGVRLTERGNVTHGVLPHNTNLGAPDAPNAGNGPKSNKPPSLPRRTPPRPKPPQRPMR